MLRLYEDRTSVNGYNPRLLLAHLDIDSS